VLGRESELDVTHSLVLYLQDVLGKNSELDDAHSLVLYLQDIIGRHEEKTISPNNKTILTLGNHIHSAHYHMNPHYCTEIPLEDGWVSSVSYKAITLIGEFHGNQDLDNNDLIYGRDFKIIDDSEKPPVLKSIENSPSWIEPINMITWNQYLEGYH